MRMSKATDTKGHLFELLREFDTTMLVTVDNDGGLHARPMAVGSLEADGDTYLVTSIESPKVAEIEDYPNVTLTFQSDHQFAALRGRATIVRDRKLIEKLWKEPWKVWFPKGKDDPAIALLRFDAQSGEYWDNSGLQGLKYAFAAAKSYAKGDRPEADEDQHSRVRL
jgi:general stress protein 26